MRGDEVDTVGGTTKAAGDGGDHTRQRHMVIHDMGDQQLSLERRCSSLITRERPQERRGPRTTASWQKGRFDARKRSVRVGDDAARCKARKAPARPASSGPSRPLRETRVVVGLGCKENGGGGAADCRCQIHPFLSHKLTRYPTCKGVESIYGIRTYIHCTYTYITDIPSFTYRCMWLIVGTAGRQSAAGMVNGMQSEAKGERALVSPPLQLRR